MNLYLKFFIALIPFAFFYPSLSYSDSKEPLPPSLIDRDGWKVLLSGYIETDVIVDSTRNLHEAIGNNPIERPDTSNGANGQAQISVRNSRLALAIDAPPVQSWKTRGFIESDFLGYDPPPGPNNTESAFFSNPTWRIRHAYLQANSEDGFQILAGQTWQLFGWQPYYFMATAEVAPIPAMAYHRTPQLRGMKTFSLDEKTSVQAALAVVRPPQRDSGYPDLQAGIRLALGSRTSGFTGGSAGPVKTQPMSVGLSGLLREFRVPTSGSTVADTNSFVGSAVAIDFMIPLIASPDGTEVGNTLSLLGEYTRGTGYGDQFIAWTGNQANPLSTSPSAFSNRVNLDAGIGDYDSLGNFSLVSLSTFNLHLQYHFPIEWRTWASMGVGQLQSDNVDSLTPLGNGRTSANRVPYDREQIAFLNLFHSFTDPIRVGLEFAHIETTYADGVIGRNNRFQLTTLFLF